MQSGAGGKREMERRSMTSSSPPSSHCSVLRSSLSPLFPRPESGLPLLHIALLDMFHALEALGARKRARRGRIKRGKMEYIVWRGGEDGKKRRRRKSFLSSSSSAFFLYFSTPLTKKKKKKKLNKQTDLLASALDHATDVDARVRPIISNLKGIKKALDRLSHAKAASTEEVQHYQQMLAAIDAKRSDGVFGGTLADVPAGQAQAVELLEQAFERAHALLEGATDMDSHLKAEVFEPLVKHKRRE